MRNVRAKLVVLVLAGVCSAAANQITIGPSNENVTFTPGGGGIIDVQFGACGPLSCTLTGPALFPNLLVGTYELTMKPVVVVPFGPNGGVDNYPAMPNWLSSQGTFILGLNAVTLPVNYEFLFGASPNVQFTGNLGPNPNYYFDYSLQKLTCTGMAVGNCNIQAIAALNPGQGTAFATISSGEFVTPEPVSIVLVGASLGGLGLLRRWRRLA